MLSRIGFRRILPMSFFALHLLLSLYGYYHQPELDPLGKHARPQQRFDQPRTRTPLAWDIDIVVNLPAFILGFIVVLLARAGSNIAGLICASPFVLILWLLIGLWVDWQVGWLKFSARKQVISGISIGGIVISAITLLLVIIGAPLSGPSEARWPAITFAFWTLLVLAISIISLVRPMTAKKKRSPKAALG
jgi:hypothetical protein